MSTPGSPNIRIDMNMVGLPPGMIITSSGDTCDLEALVQVGGDRFAQRQNAVRRRVAMMAVAQRLDRGLDDEIRRAEIRLADAEADDVAALRGKRVGARQHGEGVFLADAIESGDCFQHGVSPGLLFSRRSSTQPAAKCKPGAQPDKAAGRNARGPELYSGPLRGVPSAPKIIRRCANPIPAESDCESADPDRRRSPGHQGPRRCR